MYFRNPLFLMWKPTVFYWAIAIVFLGSRFISDKPLVQRFFGLVDEFSFEKITPQQWQNLNIIWVVFHIFAGFLNIYVAYNYEFEIWATFKVFGLMALSFVFLLGQMFWIANQIGDDETEETEEKE